MKTTIVDNFECVDMSDLKMPLIVIYEKPSDFPDKFVARLWDLDRPSDIVVIRDTKKEIRKTIPCHLTCMARKPLDDIAIVEVWL